MTILVQLLLAIAVIAAAGLVTYALTLRDMPEAARRAPRDRAQAYSTPRKACTDNARVITTGDRVRFTIEFINELATRGDMRGDRVDPQRIAYYVRTWAADQPEPACLLEVTNMCDANYRKTYAQGYQLVTEALVREAVHRAQRKPSYVLSAEHGLSHDL